MLLQIHLLVFLLLFLSAANTVVDLLLPVHNPESFIHLFLTFGPLDLLHVAICHSLLELALPPLALLHLFLLVFASLEVRVRHISLLELFLLKDPPGPFLHIALNPRLLHKLTLLLTELQTLLLLHSF